MVEIDVDDIDQGGLEVDDAGMTNGNCQTVNRRSLLKHNMSIGLFGYIFIWTISF